MNKKIKFPAHFKHNHPPVKNVNDIIKEKESFSEKASNFVAQKVGSWRFIIFQSAILFIWVILNITAYIYHWDPYPFILMNLFLSLQAAYTAPIIMMSQNKQAERDRIEAHNDYYINLKAEEEVRVILDHLQAQNYALEQIHNLLVDASVTPKG